jgi:hypothetical protein
LLDAESGLEVRGAAHVECEAVEMGLKVCEVEHERARVGVGALEGGDRERLGVCAGALGDGEEVVEAVAGLEELGVEVEAEGLGVGELGWEEVGMCLIPELIGLSVLDRARPWVGSSGGRRGQSGRTQGGQGRAGIPRWRARDRGQSPGKDRHARGSRGDRWRWRYTPRMSL